MDVTADVGGWVVEILVEEGAAVDRGATLLLLESMKMEIVVAAPRAGVVEAVLVRDADVVEPGQVLVRLAA